MSNWENFGRYRLCNDDCLVAMDDIPAKSVDMVLCDPPYGTTACKWDAVIPFEPMWEHLKWITKDTAAIVLTASQPFTSALVMSNPKMFKYDWCWKKSRITNVLNAKKQPCRQHESILVFCAASPQYNAQGIEEVNRKTKQGGCSDNYGKRNTDEYTQKFTNWPRSVLEIKSEGKTIHPTQKPVPLMEYLIKTYTSENQIVLDFTMGSGTTGVACMNLNRRFLGIEKDATYYEIAKKRIEESKVR